MLIDKTKIKNILGSIKFWEAVLASLVKVLATYGVIPDAIADPIIYLLGVSITIDVIGGVATKIGNK